MSAKATVNGKVIARSNDYEEVEGNIYFPSGDVDNDVLEESETTTTCPWKGEASYYHLVVDGERFEDKAWYYPQPKDEASHIEDHIAFYTDTVTVEKEA